MRRKQDWITTALFILCKHMHAWPDKPSEVTVTPDGWSWAKNNKTREMVLTNKDASFITRGEWRAAMERDPVDRKEALRFAAAISQPQWPAMATSSIDCPRGWFWRDPMNGGHTYLSLPRWRESAGGTPVGHPVTLSDAREEIARLRGVGTPAKPSKPAERPYSKYRKDVSELDEIDVYDVCEMFAINDPSGATQHAIKKLLLSGQRTGGKAASVDIAEAIDSLKRAQQLAKAREE